MNKILLSMVVILSLIFLITPLSLANAQMMGAFNGDDANITSDEITKTKQEEQTGKTLYDLFKSGGRSCQSLNDDDFEKLGEYFMGQMAGSTENHVYMDKMMQSRMNADEEAYHIAIGKNQSGCNTNNNSGFNKGGVYSMMGYGFGNMMGGYGYGSYFGIFSFLMGFTFWLVLVLLAIYLYQKIKNPKK